MAATRNDLRQWLLKGGDQQATHVIIACDTFDWSDYPVYVQPDQKVVDEIAKYDGKNMQRVMEVYNLNLDIDAQLEEYRAWHL